MLTNPLRDERDRRLARIAGPSTLVIFGATGDLARKKLLPALYDLTVRGLLPPGFSIVGVGRPDPSGMTFAEVVKQSVKAGARTEFDEDTWAAMLSGIRHIDGEFTDEETFTSLAETLHHLTKTRTHSHNAAFYLAIPPGLFPPVCKNLERAGLVDQSRGWRRVVIEKPFGHNLASARELNWVAGRVFPEDSIFRIDHYLGKETVQNILALRFANEMFEPLLHRNSVDHVQITMAEDIGVTGRAAYYDGVGAARDVIQNHLLQLLALTAMEAPVSFDAADLRAEKQKVLAAARVAPDLAASTARGQYVPGWQGSQFVRGYTEEDGIDPHSRTETYAALKVMVDSRRWAGVPFYIRTGKRLGRRVTEIAVTFKTAPHIPAGLSGTHQSNNALVMRIQPDEGTTVRFGSKVPGTAFDVRDVTMDFAYGDAFSKISPEAYERLILDVLLGEPPLFPQHTEVELSWQLLDPVTEYWANSGSPDAYRAGTWGPGCADAMLRRDGRTWRRP